MQFTARVVSNAQFNQWVNSVKQSPNNLTWDAYTQLAQPSTDHQVILYGNVADNLFNSIIMKYVGPDAAEMGMKMPGMSPSNTSTTTTAAPAMSNMAGMNMQASS